MAAERRGGVARLTRIVVATDFTPGATTAALHERALIGGVSELVIDAATCDVFVVPPPIDATDSRAKGASR